MALKRKKRYQKKEKKKRRRGWGGGDGVEQSSNATAEQTISIAADIHASPWQYRTWSPAPSGTARSCPFLCNLAPCCASRTRRNPGWCCKTHTHTHKRHNRSVLINTTPLHNDGSFKIQHNQVTHEHVVNLYNAVNESTKKKIQNKSVLLILKALYNDGLSNIHYGKKKKH